MWKLSSLFSGLEYREIMLGKFSCFKIYLSISSFFFSFFKERSRCHAFLLIYLVVWVGYVTARDEMCSRVPSFALKLSSRILSHADVLPEHMALHMVLLWRLCHL